MTSKTESRLTFSALYYGIKKQEQELLGILRRRIAEKRDLKVTLLFDYTRGTRKEEFEGKSQSSVDALRNLVVDRRVKVSFYLSPLFTKSWFTRSLLYPRQKYNEIIELQHMKCFIFDDDIIISGANLSESYFTNRDDRYILVKNCPKLSDYFHDVIDTVSSFSMKLSSDGGLDVDSNDCKHHPLENSTRHAFIQDGRAKIDLVQKRHSSNCELELNEEVETLIVPLLQMSTYCIDEERRFINHVFSTSPSNSIVKLASGYFNLTFEYIDVLLKNQSRYSSVDVLVASEGVNSFYGAKGLIGRIPSVYTTFSRSFFHRIEKLNETNPIRMYLFQRPNWTFHAKGLWMHLNPGTAEETMMATIGSSNFGYRSSYKDLENQVVILTKNDQLKKQFTDEYSYFWSYGHKVSKSSDFPHVPLWVRIVSKLIKGYF